MVVSYPDYYFKGVVHSLVVQLRAIVITGVLISYIVWSTFGRRKETIRSAELIEKAIVSRNIANQ